LNRFKTYLNRFRLQKPLEMEIVMVMAIPAGDLRSAPHPAVLDAIRAAWQVLRERRVQRVALRRAGRLGPRLLADMGIDPATVRAVSGGWDQLLPNGYLVQPRGR
jgi:uncharacterized protein YjiS (DUF1127 family)